MDKAHKDWHFIKEKLDSGLIIIIHVPMGLQQRLNPTISFTHAKLTTKLTLVVPYWKQAMFSMGLNMNPRPVTLFYPGYLN
ncbi:hypothetical protein CR513_23362, partial [Mucuna pruriens]